MPRPTKPRRISYIPEDKYFIPLSKENCQLEEIQIKFEELEAMRLKDIEKLSQEECAVKMQVSRQTFQLIIDKARKKVAQALISGKAIHIKGGNYTLNVCEYRCKKCGYQYNKAYENTKIDCPRCKSYKVDCSKENSFCKKKCKK